MLANSHLYSGSPTTEAVSVFSCNDVTGDDDVRCSTRNCCVVILAAKRYSIRMLRRSKGYTIDSKDNCVRSQMLDQSSGWGRDSVRDGLGRRVRWRWRVSCCPCQKRRRFVADVKSVVRNCLTRQGDCWNVSRVGDYRNLSKLIGRLWYNLDPFHVFLLW